MTFICKKCKKAFRKDMSVYEESDEYCPHCDNHYVRSSQIICRITLAQLSHPFSVYRLSRRRHRRLPLGLRERTHASMHGTSLSGVIVVHRSESFLCRLLKDERTKSDTSRSLFREDISDRLG